jgi:uncharacterized protein
MQRYSEPDPDPIDTNSPIHVAVAAKHASYVKSILKRDSQAVNRVDRYGWTPLYRAVNDNNMAMIVLLLSYNADPDIQDALGWTPLYRSIYDSNIVVVSLLLKHLANPNKPDNLGLTPLHRALYNRSKGAIYITLVKLLLDHGANPHLSFKNELSPAQIMNCSGDTRE